MTPELIADYRCQTGEGPIWHPIERRLYWLDIPAGRMFRYDPASGHHEICYEGEPVGGLTIQADGALLLLGARGTVRIWREGRLTTVVEEIPEARATRFNDAIADPQGRVFSGTMPVDGEPSRLYRIDPDASVTRVLDGLGQSNGMGFTPDREGLYWTDTIRRSIFRFRYDAAAGTLSDRKWFAQVPDGEGVPDGLTVDAEGYVWSARWGGGCVVRYAPDGAEDRRIQFSTIDFPALQVSCPAFGGEDYAELYVTTAGGDDKAANGMGAGALFRVLPGVRGVPEFFSRIGL